MFGLFWHLTEPMMRDTQKWKENMDNTMIKPISPDDTSWDEFSPPKCLYLLIAIYTIIALAAGPPLFQRENLHPLHLAFFVFNLTSLIVNFCLFMNALVIYYSKGSFPIKLLAWVIEPHGKMITNITWVHCAFRVFEFLGEALVILHHEHDNYRVLRITYFLISLINIWRQLRFGSPSFFSMSNFYSMLMDLTLFLYSHFEPSLHTDYPKMRARIEQIVCAMEIGQMVSICMQVLSVGPRNNSDQEGESSSSSTLSRAFKWYMFWYSTLTVVMLCVISQNVDSFNTAGSQRPSGFEHANRSRVRFDNYRLGVNLHKSTRTITQRNEESQQAETARVSTDSDNDDRASVASDSKAVLKE